MLIIVPSFSIFMSLAVMCISIYRETGHGLHYIRFSEVKSFAEMSLRAYLFALDAVSGETTQIPHITIRVCGMYFFFFKFLSLSFF